jgi:hypothetical protein
MQHCMSFISQDEWPKDIESPKHTNITRHPSICCPSNSIKGDLQCHQLQSTNHRPPSSEPISNYNSPPLVSRQPQAALYQKHKLTMCCSITEKYECGHSPTRLVIVADYCTTPTGKGCSYYHDSFHDKDGPCRECLLKAVKELKLELAKSKAINERRTRAA